MDKVDGIPAFPKLGRKVPEIDSPYIREMVFGNYRLIYRLRDNTATVLTIRHFKQILPLEELSDS